MLSTKSQEESKQAREKVEKTPAVKSEKWKTRLLPMKNTTLQAASLAESNDRLI